MNPASLNALIPAGLMQVPVGVVVFDTGLRIVGVNEAAERLTGGPPGYGMGRAPAGRGAARHGR